MHQMNFPVRHRYPADGPGITVEVSLRSNGHEFRTPAKVDTGAEFCVFSRDIADAPEIDVESGHLQKMSTFAGVFDTYGHELSYSVLGHQFTGVLYCVAAQQEFARNVLGRHGWLDRLRVGIIDHGCYLLVAAYES